MGGSEKVPWDEPSLDIHRFQEQSAKDARIHFIGFQLKENHRSELQ
tara:strand:+ start:7572 stop:7709 length:138 start_codon:yes stop_codon:yes gene_type:complete